MQMDSYNYTSFFHDEAPFYPHVAVPPSPELPFGLIASPGEPPFAPPMPTAFQDYDYPGAAVGVGAGAPFGGPSVHGQMIDALSGMGGEGQREQSMAMVEDVEEQEEPPRRRRAAGGRHGRREQPRVPAHDAGTAAAREAEPELRRPARAGGVPAAAIYIHELRGAREQLQHRNEDLKARILGHDAGQQCVKVQFEVDEPASAIDSMIGALRRLKGMDVRARGIRSNLSGRRLCTEMNVETTIAAGDVEKAVEEALMQEVERKQQQLGTGSAAAAPGFAGPQASSHVQNVF
ncbi:unnamed protein product [Miscanthus lutarioriparius]|uniref:BHLH domain-containing protein n=1 Tax=Miscanthus lutarioriparius TaxID=422564 RepID=A0A811MGX3_9POAL|nr:unnamed protein product [Miscanthus lutarioriparius]